MNVYRNTRKQSKKVPRCPAMKKEYRLRCKRLASFRDRRMTISSSRSKKAKTINATWPHLSTSKLSPESLADAGFFFDPDEDTPDKTVCFICELSLANWEGDDEPRAEHLKRSNSCIWTVARWSLRKDRVKHGKSTVLVALPSRLDIVLRKSILWSVSSWRFNSDDRIPTHPARIEARLRTFISWPHDKKKGHNCTSKALAQAGFVHVPDDSDGEDMVICDYCNRSLSGWEPDDIPIEEHRRNNMTICPFLEAYDREQALLADQAVAVGKAKSVKHARAISKSSKEPDSNSEFDSDLDAGSYSRAKARRRQSSTRPSRASPPENDSEVEPLTKPTRKSKRTMSKSKVGSKIRRQSVPTTQSAVIDEDEMVMPLKSRFKKAKGKAIVEAAPCNSGDDINLQLSNVESQSSQLSSDAERHSARRSRRTRQSKALAQSNSHTPSMASHSRTASRSRNSVAIKSQSRDNSSVVKDETPVKLPARPPRGPKRVRESKVTTAHDPTDASTPKGRRLGRSASTRALSSVRQFSTHDVPRTRTRTSSKSLRTSTSSRTRGHSRTTSMQSLGEYETGVTTDTAGMESALEGEDVSCVGEALKPETKGTPRTPPSTSPGRSEAEADHSINNLLSDGANSISAVSVAPDTPAGGESTPLASRNLRITMDGNPTSAPQLPRSVSGARLVSTNSLPQASAKGSSAAEIDVLEHISKVMEAVHPAKPKRAIAALPRRSPRRPSPSPCPSPPTERTPTLNRHTPSRIKQFSPPRVSMNYCNASVATTAAEPSIPGIGASQNEEHSGCLSFKEKGTSKPDGIPELQSKDSGIAREGEQSLSPSKNLVHVDNNLPNAEQTEQVPGHRVGLDTQPASMVQLTSIPSLPSVTSLPPEGFTEEQLDMTIQQFIEAETQRIYQSMKRNGEQLIQEFIQEGKRQRTIIASHLGGLAEE